MRSVGYHATFTHYHRHLDPILDLLPQLGVEITGLQQRTMLVAGVPDIAKVKTAERVILLEHGAGQTYRIGNRVYDPQGDRLPLEAVTLYLATNQRIADHMAPRLPNATIAVVGCPAVERLYWRIQQSRRRRRITFAVHWSSPLRVPEAGTSWPWSMDILRALIAKYGPRVLVHAHPRIQHRVKTDLRRARLDVDFEPDWDTAAALTNLLVVDNSSIIWEADAVGIPVALIDPPNWNPEADHGLRWGPEARRLPRITGPDLQGLSDARLANAAVFGVLDGSTRKAVDAILDHIPA